MSIDTPIVLDLAIKKKGKRSLPQLDRTDYSTATKMEYL
jgi:hypothetical protein